VSEDPRFSALFARRTEGVRLGLDAVIAPWRALGEPGRGIPTVHVVGTNGKGSTAALCAHALGRGGLRVGLYTSPHLHRVGERVRIDGEATGDDTLAGWLDRVLAVEDRAPRRLTFFEILTLAALVGLAERSVDAIVAEAGLGGRLDATRLVDAKVVAVTSIALDHREWLGDDVVSIAREKAAVLRAGVPCHAAPQLPEVAAVLHEIAAAAPCSLAFVEPLARAPVGLPGAHQRINAALALACARELAPRTSAADLDGLAWPGRLESLPWCGGTLVVDVAHNPAGMAALVDAMLASPPARPLAVAFACQPDKDRAGMLAELARLRAPVWTVPLDREADWIDRARAHLGAAGTLLVTGSHLVVASARAHALGLGAAEPSDPRRPR
jgi:dihydrofolate synthase/folylpolyglutamate synthase